MSEKYIKIIASNRKASFHYFLEEKMEAGIILTGPEVKSLRLKSCNIEDSHANFMDDGFYIHNLYIAEYEKANAFSKLNTRRPRKLLLHSKEIKRLIGKVEQRGYSLIPVSMYFNNKNRVKIELALAKGKKLHDKRETLKQKVWAREKQQLIRGKE